MLYGFFLKVGNGQTFKLNQAKKKVDRLNFVMVFKHLKFLCLFSYLTPCKECQQV